MENSGEKAISTNKMSVMGEYSGAEIFEAERGPMIYQPQGLF